MTVRLLKEGLKLHSHSIKAGLLQSPYNNNHLISWYCENGLTLQARNLFDEMPERTVFSWNTLIHAYIKSHNLRKAQALFDSAPRNTVTYNLMISGYAQANGYENEAVELFIRMQCDDDETTRMEESTLTTMLKLVAKLKDLSYGRQLHSVMVKSGNDLSKFALSSLVDMYSKCGSFLDSWRVVPRPSRDVDSVLRNAMVAACCREGELEMAMEVFLSEPELNDVVSWNTMISGFVQNGREEEAVSLFKRMSEDGFCWNEHTIASVLSLCAARKSLKHGKEVHGWVLKGGMCSNPFISSGIVEVYLKCGNMKYAENFHSGRGNLFSDIAMIVEYSAKGQMLAARSLFDMLPERNLTVWTAIISGYVKLRQCEDAFTLFREYVASKPTGPDPVLLVNLLGACAIGATLDRGKQIHAFMLRTGTEMDKKVTSTLMDTYSKCGTLSYAERIFQRFSSRDAVIYNIMIAAQAHHGFECEAIRLFEEMIEQNFKPDSFTFIALLSACRHSGLVEAGEKYFLSMTKDYGIEPIIDHYSCMVDLYGRSNHLEKAMALVEEMPFEPDAVVVSAFLNACRKHKNADLAKITEKKLLEIEDYNGSRHFQLASIYASEGKWDEKGRVMRTIREKETKKQPACSWIHVGGGIHAFISDDRSHKAAEDIYCILGCLIDELCMAELAQIDFHVLL